MNHTNIHSTVTKTFTCFFLFPFSMGFAQEPQQKSNFWSNVQFGGGFGLSVGNGYSDIMVAPSGIYNLNDYVSMGLGVQYSYAKQSPVFNSHLYGASLINLFNPIPDLQLSAELEQLRVNNTFTEFTPEIKDNFWNTALFLGAGYRNQNVTVGLRYNILYKESNYVYSQGWMPFVRVYF